MAGSEAAVEALQLKAEENPDLKEAYAEKISAMKKKGAQASGLTAEAVEKELQKTKSVFNGFEELLQQKAQGLFKFETMLKEITQGLFNLRQCFKKSTRFVQI